MNKLSGLGFINQRGESRDDANNVYAMVDGMEYGTWIGARGGHSSGDLITHPVGVIESLLRDWKHRENDLVIATVIASPPDLEISIANAKYKKNDYYNGAYLHDVTENYTSVVTDFEFDGSNRRHFYFSGWTAGASSNDDCFLTNVNCNIDTDTFDAVESDMASWKFTRSINEKLSSEELLDEALFESHCILIPSYDEYKLVQIADGTEVATLGDPLKRGGDYDIQSQLTSPLDIYTSYRIEYAYDHGRQEYLAETFVNRNGSSDATNLGSTYRNACDNAAKNYKVEREFRYSCNWISDETTAEYFTQKMVSWHTTQKLRLIGKWSIGDTAGGSSVSPIRLEPGDLVKVNTSWGKMPTSKNNSVKFMIDGKTISPNYNYVSFSMTEMV